MKGYLLDTNVVSMLSPSQAEASPAFLDWLERVDVEGAGPGDGGCHRRRNREGTDLSIVTRNTRHFLPFGVAISSPDEAAG